MKGNDMVPRREQRVHQRQHHTCRNAAAHAADGTLHGFVGADDGRQLVLAEGAAGKVGCRVAAPGKAEDQQDKVDGVIAVRGKGQHPL